ncbi:hypothetical protein I317_03491 [Kwoniella heveanensis CBS 569]|nr:hypothetical protein I317_03491 [Kwoniella heveanensis CBS 569]
MSAPAPPPPGGAGPARPASPRSPRPAPSSAGTGAGGPGVPGAIPPGSFVIPPELQGQHPPRPNISSMLFMTAFFFFMSGGNHYPASGGLEVGPDGEIRHKMSELDHARLWRDEWRGVVNGSDTEAQMNYTQPSIPPILPSRLIPPQYTHHLGQVHHHHPDSGPSTYTPTNVFTNITGFYRSANLHPLPLEDVPQLQHRPEYWKHVTSFPSLNDTRSDAAEGWNATKAEELRGSWDWANTVRWDMNLKERNISAPTTNSDDADKDNDMYPEWTWVKGSGTLTTSEDAKDGRQSISYDFYGLHYKPNGTYNLFAMPEGMRVDIRKLPYLWMTAGGKKDGNGTGEGAGITAKETKGIILRELEKEVAVQEDLLIISDVRDDDISEITTCPLLIHLTLPPIPRGTSREEIEEYEQELQNPTGLLSSMRRPPRYWESSVGLGGVIVADGCGWVMGIEGGHGMAIYDFWNESVRYSVYAGIAQLVVLLLLVRQMESTRTPSTLAKVSLYTIIIMSITDSWVFSAHIVVAIMSDNRASLSMVIPAFLCFATAIVFGPRYAVLLHRIQLPERSTAPVTPAAGQANAGAAAGEAGTDGGVNAATVLASTQRRVGSVAGGVRSFFTEHPLMKWICVLGFLFFFINIAFLPNVIPFFIVGLYSFWVPQIWRNARRGNSQAMDPTFVIGTTAGRLALPLYAFVYADNIFFVEKANWVWLLVAWQLLQVGLLFAQERFGPAFLLPKSLAPPESYNYHPLIPNRTEDPESSTPLLSLSGDGESEKTCSICMEEVDLSQSSLTSHAGLGGLGDKRRSYALAPCGHLFHTKCLSQWMAIKTICPLCKRSLPPL